jgi:hypothetical protein
MSLQSEKFLSYVASMKTRALLRHSLKLELAAEILQRFSELRFVAHGTSMLPSIYPGDCLTVKSFGSAAPRCGDIVLCRHAGEFRVHRIVRILKPTATTLYIVRGDALEQDDPPVLGCELLGRVTSVLRRARPLHPGSGTGLCHRALRSMVRRSKVTLALLLGWHAALAQENPELQLLRKSVTAGMEWARCR